MRVLKSGREQAPFEVTAKCSGIGNNFDGCGALLQMGFDDLRFYAGGEGRSSTRIPPAVCFRCPECEVITDLPASEWPPNYGRLREYSSQWAKYGPG